jgi:hypothetical protein
MVRGEDLYLCAMLGGEAAQPGLVVAACLPVGLQDGLEQSQAGWRARVHGVDFAVEEVRVSGMQEPLRAGSGRCLGTDRHGGVAAGVPGKRDEQQVGRQALQLPDRLESEPSVFAGVAVGDPVGPVRELDFAVPRGTSFGVFGLKEMDLRPGKVGQAAGMIQVEVGCAAYE